MHKQYNSISNSNKMQSQNRFRFLIAFHKEIGLLNHFCTTFHGLMIEYHKTRKCTSKANQLNDFIKKTSAARFYERREFIVKGDSGRGGHWPSETTGAQSARSAIRTESTRWEREQGYRSLHGRLRVCHFTF